MEGFVQNVARMLALTQKFPGTKFAAVADDAEAIRALGAAFVWVRIINSVQEDIFAFMPSEDLQETTKEWLTLFLPIIVTEMWLNWGPVALKLFQPNMSPHRSR